MTAIMERPALADDTNIDSRLKAFDWTGVAADLDAHGYAILEGALPAEECESVAGLYNSDDLFRSHIVMARHGFGRGEYKYFSGEPSASTGQARHVSRQPAAWCQPVALGTSAYAGRDISRCEVR